MTCRWTALLITLLLFGVGPSFAAADADCRVQLGRGWSGGTGAGTIVMKNNGKPCGTTLYSVPDASITVESIQVARPPQNGTITVEVPRFLYTPKDGFTGRDNFRLTAEGPDRERRGRVKLGGDVTVQVNQ